MLATSETVFGDGNMGGKKTEQFPPEAKPADSWRQNFFICGSKSQQQWWRYLLDGSAETFPTRFLTNWCLHNGKILPFQLSPESICFARSHTNTFVETWAEQSFRYAFGRAETSNGATKNFLTKDGNCYKKSAWSFLPLTYSWQMVTKEVHTR